MRTFKSPLELIRRGTSWAYRRSLRHLIPVREAVRFAGVDIDMDRKFGDSLLIPQHYRSMLMDIPDYEQALVRGLNMYVKSGMTVVIVGGGIGVTAVIAAQIVGPLGRVICYEGSQINVGRIRETARRNGVSHQLEVHYGLVGPAIAIYHNDNAAPTVDIGNLPECDVMEMDCEGSEKYIIADLSIHPQHIIVETHGVYGASTDEIDTLLRQRGYDTLHLGLAEPRAEAACIKKDIRVIAAIRRSAV